MVEVAGWPGPSASPAPSPPTCCPSSGSPPSNPAPTHEIERQGRWKQGGGMVGRYTCGESAGSALRYL